MDISEPGKANKLMLYIRLMRLDKPIGIYLLLWPTLWALWIAAEGVPDGKLVVIFIVGTILMRSAGCIINDYADRDLDRHVKRTVNRPLTTGELSSREALIVFALLCIAAFVLVLFTNTLTVLMSFVAVALTATYPFMKRYTHLPQLVLGAAFAWAIPMAFTAQTGGVTQQTWLLYATTLLWVVAYDTLYAMVDRDDDIKVGIKSTAVLFGEADRAVVAGLQVSVLLGLALLGQQIEAGISYYIGLIAGSGFFLYQHWLIRHRERQRCFQAFLNNHWFGSLVFAGLFLDYLLKI